MSQKQSNSSTANIQNTDKVDTYTTESKETIPTVNPTCWTRFIRWLQRIPLQKLMLCIRIINVIFAVILFVLYPLSFALHFDKIKEDGSIFTNVMLMIYCCTFAALLLVFEARVAKMDKRMNHLFGFMFSFLGRAFFMCFLGTLAFAGDGILNWVVGSIAIVFAILQCVIMYNHPAFQSDGELSNRTSRLKGNYSSVDQDHSSSLSDGKSKSSTD